MPDYDLPEPFIKLTAYIQYSSVPDDDVPEPFIKLRAYIQYSSVPDYDVPEPFIKLTAYPYLSGGNMTIGHDMRYPCVVRGRRIGIAAKDTRWSDKVEKVEAMSSAAVSYTHLTLPTRR